MTKHKLTLAGRKWRRQFNDAVVQSIAKTITEPVTNAYDSFKRLFGKNDQSTGLIDAILALPVGGHLVHEDLLAQLPKRTSREIAIRISRTGRGETKRECVVIDAAEGMSATELETKFEKYGAEKSGASEGHSVRGLFGQGICDVVYSHSPGAIRTVKENRAAECLFTWGGPPSEAPEYEVIDRGAVTSRVRQDWGLSAGNGTAVSFVLAEKCRLPQTPEALVARLSNFYMLRLINADPACNVRLDQVRHGATESSRLQYFFPRGQVVKPFHAKIEFEEFPPMVADGIIVRSDSPLPSKESGDDRATGLLIVDEADAVYDQTFFRFESSPYLDHVYGVIRLTGLREILRSKLESGEALLTESRDGFDAKKGLYRALDEQLFPILDPIFRKEIERRSQPEKGLSQTAEKKLKKAFEKLNDLFEDLTKEQVTGTGTGGTGLKVPEGMEFEEPRLQLRAGLPRHIRVLGNAAVARPDSLVIIDSDSNHIKVEPTSVSWISHPKVPNLLVIGVVLNSDKIGASGKIQALGQALDGSSLEATQEITDVVAPVVIEPPIDGLEFSPRMPTSSPSRRGTLALLIDPARVPIGTEIQVSRKEQSSPVMLVTEANDDTTTITVALEEHHFLPGGRVARITIGFRGYGFGQRATFFADCFKGKSNLRARADVSIEEPKSPTGGVFKGVIYRDLPGGMRKSTSEFDRTTGMITINRLHPINRAAFGIDEAQFRKAVDEDGRAQNRLADVVLDQCLYHTAFVAYQNSHLVIPQDDVIGAIRRWMEQFKYDNAEGIYREMVGNFRVPKLGPV